jgi:hypothetical protein
MPDTELTAGEVRLGSGAVVRPGLTAEQWRALPGSTTFGPAEVDGVGFAATVHVERDRVARVSLVCADPAVTGTSWADYDPATARTWHDAFLAERLGRGKPWHEGAFPYGGVEYRMPWGTVGSYVHPQDMVATIVLAYD